jgi:hypothetical protein
MRIKGVKGITTQSVLKQLKLKEHHLYKVKVKCCKGNPWHTSFLFVGFLNGAFCTVYSGRGDMPVDLNQIYSIIIVEELTSTRG